jgi:uncharacterized membrane protein
MEVDIMAGATAEKTEKKAPATGGDRTLALVAYILSWLTGIIVFLIAKDRLAKFHGMQAIILGVIGLLISFIPFLGWLVAFLIWVYGLYVAIVYAHKGVMYKIPVIGEYAEKYSQ